MKQPCLLFHGFTGGPYEVEPLARHLRERGQLCKVPELPWHGESYHQLKSSRWEDWVKAAEEHAETMTRDYGQFDMVGFSMGGLLAAYLSVRYPVRRLILLNTAVIYVSPGRMLEEMRNEWKYQRKISLNKAKSTPLSAAWQFTRLVRKLKPELSQVSIPTLIAQSERDHVIHPQSARYIYRKVRGQREIHWHPRSNHLICHSDDAAVLFRQVSAFLDKEYTDDGKNKYEP
ncbi:alpha/beta hydrolase [Paenibacillus planticolens]|uniref:Alpha/beta fold hydrolase n=1 Tax=Paenibacillus planticolens TaxID=2654976 RepID=A0ABX1ZG51_9BACL|nr:alpha/beta fold hydrolase [Paenibacillus planticolens]NOU99070.1 alpha/beta fold hydrolase [Paenibacillus planticolens]